VGVLPWPLGGAPEAKNATPKKKAGKKK
jgi:hypothetical protein